LLPRGSVATSKPFNLAVVLLLLVSASAIRAAENPAAAFRRDWQGRRVTVQRTLLTLVYDERSRLSTVARSKRDGLVVATPSKGSFYLFTGRREVDDISHTDPDRLFATVKANYRKDRNLDDGYVQIVNPLHLVQYVKGMELVVRRVDIERSAVRLVLFKPDSTEEIATSITVAWPTPLSSDLQERGEIERLVGQFVVPGTFAQP
jgi:hypothetical protein